jgi:hypothetical protein
VFIQRDNNTVFRWVVHVVVASYIGMRNQCTKLVRNITMLTFIPQSQSTPSFFFFDFASGFESWCLLIRCRATWDDRTRGWLFTYWWKRHSTKCSIFNRKTHAKLIIILLSDDWFKSRSQRNVVGRRLTQVISQFKVVRCHVTLLLMNIITSNTP